MNKARVTPTLTKEIEKMRGMKPRFFDRESLGYLPPLTRLLFLGLYCRADERGQMEDKPRAIKNALLGYDDVTAAQVDGMLEELQTAGLIVRHQVDGFLQVAELGAR